MNLSTNIQYQAEQLGKLLKGKGWTITCAESCTGGGIGYAITAISGSSSWINEGYITYSNEAKRELLGVSVDVLESAGAVSEEVVKLMATGAAIKAGANVALAVSGIAGPDGGTIDKPVGTVWFGFAIEEKSFTEKVVFEGDRHHVREQAILFSLTKVQTIINDISS